MAMLSTKEVRMYLRIRNLCGLLGIILPWIALFSAGIVLDKPEGWWWSISATYYQSPALVGVLVPACIVMMSYIGYDWKDNFITTLTGLFGLGIVLFPCKVDWIADGSAVGHPYRLRPAVLPVRRRQHPLPVHQARRHHDRPEESP